MSRKSGEGQPAESLHPRPSALARKPGFGSERCFCWRQSREDACSSRQLGPKWVHTKVLLSDFSWTCPFETAQNLSPLGRTGRPSPGCLGCLRCLGRVGRWCPSAQPSAPAAVPGSGAALCSSWGSCGGGAKLRTPRPSSIARLVLASGRETFGRVEIDPGGQDTAVGKRLEIQEKCWKEQSPL